VGGEAGDSITTGNYNTIFGYGAGSTNITGSSNTFMGRQTGYYATGSDNTFIGYYAGGEITTGSKNTIIGKYNGNEGGLDIRTSSNNIVLSDGDGNPRVLIDSSGNLLVGTTVSGAKLNVGSDLTSIQAFRAFGDTTGDTANVCGQFAKYDNNSTITALEG
jgi:trimeric autotransporter adhesin